MTVDDTEWADIHRALHEMDATIKRQRATICLLGDLLLAAFPSVTQWEQTARTRAAAKPLRDVIEGAYALLQGHDRRSRAWSPGTALLADDLDAALAHPPIAGLIEEWTRE